MHLQGARERCPSRERQVAFLEGSQNLLTIYTRIRGDAIGEVMFLDPVRHADSISSADASALSSSNQARVCWAILPILLLIGVFRYSSCRYWRAFSCVPPRPSVSAATR